jgi:hypothetical protein
MRKVHIVILAGMASIAFLFLLNTQPDQTLKAGTLPPFHVGVTWALDNIDWSSAERLSVVLVASETCDVCAQSVQFYRTLSNLIAREISGVRLYVISPSDSWVQKAGIAAQKVSYDKDPFRLGFVIYPSIVLVAPSGLVTHLWTGRLSDGEEQEILNLIQGGKTPKSRSSEMDAHFAREVSLALLQEIQSAADRVLLLDPRDRDSFAKAHRGEARNIPLDEWEVRLRKEVSANTTIIVDCTWEVPKCRMAGWHLKELGVENVGVFMH